MEWKDIADVLHIMTSGLIEVVDKKYADAQRLDYERFGKVDPSFEDLCPDDQDIVNKVKNYVRASETLQTALIVNRLKKHSPQVFFNILLAKEKANNIDIII